MGGGVNIDGGREGGKGVVLLPVVLERGQALSIRCLSDHW